MSVELTRAHDHAVATVRGALGDARPAVVAHEIWWAMGLELLLPETVLLCAQRCSAVDMLRDRGVEVFCLSEHVGGDAAARASAVEIFAHPAVAELGARVGPLAVVATKPSERLAKAVSDVGSRLVTPPGALTAARRFENKLAFVDITRELGVPTPRWELTPADDATPYAAIASRLGSDIVVQAARGNAGTRTSMVRSAGDLERVRAAEAGRALRMAQLVAGVPATSTAVAADGGLSDEIEACRQVTGIEWLTPMSMGSCGNVWGDAEVSKHQAAISAVVAALAGAAADDEYRGVLGVDFVIGADGPVVIETNPRLVASLPLATQMEVEAGRVPLVLRHLAACLEVPLPAALDSQPLPDAYQVIVRRLPGDRGHRPELMSGIYKVGVGAPPVFVRPGAYLGDIEQADEVLLLVREPQEPVHDAKEFGRVIGRGTGGEHTPGLRESVAALRG